MIETSKPHFAAGAVSKARFPIHLKWLSALAMAVLLLAGARASAQEPDDEYIRILNLIDRAESYNTNTQTQLALERFQKARAELLNFQRSYPTWNVKLVSYRSRYLAEKVTALSAPPPVESSTPAASGTQDAASGSMAKVTLIEAGAEPRQVLRLHPQPGDKQSLSMTVQMAIETAIGDLDVPAMKLPAMTMTMDLDVKSVSAEGDIAYEMIMGEASIAAEADVLPQVAEAMKSALDGVEGTSGLGLISSRGLTKKSDLKLPAGANPQMRQTMEQMTEGFSQAALPLPEEAIGPGAKWEVKKPVKSQGMTINQTATYELVSMEGERIHVKSAVTQSASNQKIQNPAMPGLKLDLTRMTGKGAGETTLDLSRLLPSGTFDSHSDMTMMMNAGGQQQAMTTKMDINVRLEAK